MPAKRLNTYLFTLSVRSTMNTNNNTTNDHPMTSQSPATVAVHAGVWDAKYHPVTPPIYQTSTFAFENVEQGANLFAGSGDGYIYARMGNPTTGATENAIAQLEGGYAGLACGSGMAAIHTVLGTYLHAGDHMICSSAVYGPTFSLVTKILSKIGIEATMVDTSDLEAVENAFRPETKVVFIETPGNPTLVISDIAAIAKLTHAHDALLIVDNTFMSPILQRPLDLGADLVIHSLTKFINGHADVVGGMIVTKNETQQKEIRIVLNHFGGVLPPFESYLVHRGLKTLAIRMKCHCENAIQIARYLEAHDTVDWVRYPGLPSHPQYAVGQKQMLGSGALITIGLKGGIECGRAMMNAVKLHGLAVSLGGVESLIQHPASMTHASMGPEGRKLAGISDGLVRISIGIEDPQDLIDDLEQALKACAQIPQHCNK